jgi:hypothetical protein
MAGVLSLVSLSMPMGIQGVTCVLVGAEMLMYQDLSEPPTVSQCLVDRCIPTMSSQRHMLASVELVSPRQ